MPIFFIIGLVVVVVGFFLRRKWLKSRRQKELLAMSLADWERELIARRVPLLNHLPNDLRGKLEGKMNLFLEQVEFIGCNGLEITDEIELSIAAQACLLVVNTDAWYTHLQTVLVYPGAFKSVRRTHDAYVVHEEETIRTGESWQYGPVVLSWADSEQGAMNTEDGHNVVLHEFAHQLDGLSGNTDGAPLMARGQSFADWARVFTTAYDRHVKKTEAGRKTVLDAYGATNHEEFFAVAIEVFF